MATPQFEIVGAPPVSPAVIGLLQTVRPIVRPEGEWEQGITFVPSLCVNAEMLDKTCGSSTELTPSTFPAPVTHQPTVAATSGKCSTLGGLPRAEIPARIRQALELSQGVTIEAELESGAIAQAGSMDNQYLAGGSPGFENLTPGGGASSPGNYALSALQEFLGACAGGQRGMIHAPRRVITLWAASNLIRQEGNLLLDHYDNLIVAGGGYTGMSPSGDIDTTGATGWAYATGMVDVYLSPVRILPSEEFVAEAVNTRRNEAIWVAERSVAPVFDPCCHAGINVNLCEPCCDPEALGS